MTRNKAAKAAARKRAQITGKYTAALRETQREWERFLQIPAPTVDSEFTDGHIEIGPRGGHGFIEKPATPAGSAVDVDLMRRIASRYPHRRVQFATWGYSAEDLAEAGISDSGHLWLPVDEELSFPAFMNDRIVPELRRRDRECTRAQAESWSNLVECESGRGDLATLLVVVNLATADRCAIEETRSAMKLVTMVGRSLEVFLHLVGSLPDLQDVVDELKRNFGWTLPAVRVGG